ncbi:hypothetical protein M6B38_140265 [Iris pallida]|uniref:Uncharacterized protein n=1 Tax=Iris pallida TaxID=29817 RepID=A0AAX6FCY8_IRIPA|nr:hypothetical protein M6B38_140265 [Iris pallida]
MARQGACRPDLTSAVAAVSRGCSSIEGVREFQEDSRRLGRRRSRGEKPLRSRMARSGDESIFHGCSLVVPHPSSVDKLRRGDGAPVDPRRTLRWCFAGMVLSSLPTVGADFSDDDENSDGPPTKSGNERCRSAGK